MGEEKEHPIDTIKKLLNPLFDKMGLNDRYNTKNNEKYKDIILTFADWMPLNELEELCQITVLLKNVKSLN